MLDDPRISVMRLLVLCSVGEQACHVAGGAWVLGSVDIDTVYE